MFAARRVVQIPRSLNRVNFSTCGIKQKYNEPLSGHEMVRAGGIASMMRLPVHTNSDGESIFLSALYRCM